MPCGASGRVPAYSGGRLPFPPGGLLPASETGRAGEVTGMGLSARPVLRSAPLPGGAGVVGGGIDITDFLRLTGLLLLGTLGSMGVVFVTVVYAVPLIDSCVSSLPKAVFRLSGMLSFGTASYASFMASTLILKSIRCSRRA